ncbi:MAG: hypothetical protein E7576_07770 [Ruminococcaceae bacterium]|jgi:hypothetical protein|nr:hypothetical protein [Oscillospiraceae bacterium]
MTFNPSTLAHIRTLADQGATIGGSTPLTVGFCEEALTRMQQDPAVVSYNYDMALPGIDAKFMLVINRNGTVDSGSKERVEQVLRMR